MKAKAIQERAQEAGDKRMEQLKKLRKENQKRAKCINERKNKQLKTVRDERLEKQRKIQRGMQA